MIEDKKKVIIIITEIKDKMQIINTEICNYINEIKEQNLKTNILINRINKIIEYLINKKFKSTLSILNEMIKKLEGVNLEEYPENHYLNYFDKMVNLSILPLSTFHSILNKIDNVCDFQKINCNFENLTEDIVTEFEFANEILHNFIKIFTYCPHIDKCNIPKEDQLYINEETIKKIKGYIWDILIKIEKICKNINNTININPDLQESSNKGIQGNASFLVGAPLGIVRAREGQSPSRPGSNKGAVQGDASFLMGAPSEREKNYMYVIEIKDFFCKLLKSDNFKNALRIYLTMLDEIKYFEENQENKKLLYIVDEIKYTQKIIFLIFDIVNKIYLLNDLKNQINIEDLNEIKYVTSNNIIPKFVNRILNNKYFNETCKINSISSIKDP